MSPDCQTIKVANRATIDGSVDRSMANNILCVKTQSCRVRVPAGDIKESNEYFSVLENPVLLGKITQLYH